jgi:hypothetical protein
MADNLAVTAGSGSTIGMDEVVDGTLGTVKVGFGKIMDGTLDSTNKLVVSAEGAALVAGDKAHDAVDGGNPVKIGGKARSSAPTDVSATGDRVDAYFDMKGRLKTDGSDVTQPVSAASLPLPAGAATSALQTQPGVDIGDVTINNAAGGSAVNIQDGGNSITVDGSVTATVASTTITGSVAVTNAGTFAVQDSEKIADNGAFTDGTTKVAPVGYIYDEVAGTALTENDIGAARMNVNRALVGAIEDGTTRGRYATVTASNAVKVDGSAVTQPVSGTVTITPSGTQTVTGNLTTNNAAPAANNVGVLPAVANASAPSYTETDQVLLSANLSGRLRTTLDQIVGTTAVTGNGVTGTGSLRVTVASDNTPFPVKTDQTTHGTTDLVAADITKVAGVAIAQGNGTAATAIRVSLPTDGTGVVQPGNTANTTPWLVTDTASTTGGLSKFHLVGAATTNATNVKASAGQVYAITAFNVASTPIYLKFHNTAGTPTAGTAVTDTYLVPGNTAGAGVVINLDKGITFSTGIGISTVTGIADADTTAIAASSLVCNVYYK